MKARENYVNDLSIEGRAIKYFSVFKNNSPQLPIIEKKIMYPTLPPSPVHQKITFEEDKGNGTNQSNQKGIVFSSYDDPSSATEGNNNTGTTIPVADNIYATPRTYRNAYNSPLYYKPIVYNQNSPEGKFLASENKKVNATTSAAPKNKTQAKTSAEYQKIEASYYSAIKSLEYDYHSEPPVIQIWNPHTPKEGTYSTMKSAANNSPTPQISDQLDVKESKVDTSHNWNLINAIDNWFNNKGSMSAVSDALISNNTIPDENIQKYIKDNKATIESYNNNSVVNVWNTTMDVIANGSSESSKQLENLFDNTPKDLINYYKDNHTPDLDLSPMDIGRSVLDAQ